jgi:hypothetical protein
MSGETLNVCHASWLPLSCGWRIRRGQLNLSWVHPSARLSPLTSLMSRPRTSTLVVFLLTSYKVMVPSGSRVWYTPSPAADPRQH